MEVTGENVRKTEEQRGSPAWGNTPCRRLLWCLRAASLPVRLGLPSGRESASEDGCQHSAETPEWGEGRGRREGLACHHFQGLSAPLALQPQLPGQPWGVGGRAEPGLRPGRREEAAATPIGDRTKLNLSLSEPEGGVGLRGITV